MRSGIRSLLSDRAPYLHRIDTFAFDEGFNVNMRSGAFASIPDGPNDLTFANLLPFRDGVIVEMRE